MKAAEPDFYPKKSTFFNGKNHSFDLFSPVDVKSRVWYLGTVGPLDDLRTCAYLSRCRCSWIIQSDS